HLLLHDRARLDRKAQVGKQRTRLVDPRHQALPPAELIGDPWRRDPVQRELGVDDLLRERDVTVPQVDPPIPELPHLVLRHQPVQLTRAFAQSEWSLSTPSPPSRT